MGWIPAVGRRGDITQPPTPPPEVDFGPRPSRQAIIDNAGPGSVTAPPGAISFASISALSTAIAANPADSHFVATATSYTISSSPGLTWSVGKRPRIWFPGAPGTRTITSTGDFTGFSAPTPTSSDDQAYFEVHGGTFTGFGTSGSANPRAAFIRRGPCILEDVEATSSRLGLMSAAGQFDFGGHGLNGDLVTIRRCYFHDNWLGGISDGGYGDAGGGHQQNYLIERTEFSGNNAGLNNPGGDSGGIKLLFCIGTFRENYSHDNLTWGLWWDSCNKHIHAFQVTTPGALDIYDNVVENNARAGYFFERSGYGHLHHNWAVGNGTGGLIGGQPQTVGNSWQMLVRNSRNDEVDHNDVDMSTGAGRTLGIANQAGEISMNTVAHDNRVWLRSSGARVGGYDDNSPETLFTEPSIDWMGNTYMVDTLTGSYWQWSANEAAINWTAWQSIDTTGTRIEI